MRIKPARLLALLALAAAPTWAAAADTATLLARIDASGIFAGLASVEPTPAPQAQQPAPAPVPSGDRAQPDWPFTPGKLCAAGDPDFKEYRYQEQIPYCNRHVTQQMKEQVAAHYGIPKSDWGNYEFDHLLPLAIGGNSHVENLWPQPRGAEQSDGKDKLEYDLFLQMQAGKLSQADAVKQIYAWFTANRPDIARAAATPY